MLLKITKYSHHFSCDTPFTQVRNFLNDFAHQYAEKEVKKVKGRIQISYPKVYASINVNRTSFRFHINTFQQFIDFMIRYNFPTNQYQIVTAEGFDPDDSDMNITAPYPPHDYQVPLIEYLCDTGIQKVLSLQTGLGKTFTALHAIARIKKRTIIVLPGKYVERWVGDLCGTDKVLDLTPSDVRLVRGSAAMVTLLEDGVAGTLTEKVIIITATTLYNYYKAYNENSVDYESYPCPPYDMYKVLGVGVRIIDEVHENIHLNYTQDLFTHIYKTISLSATLEFDNKTTDRMCNILFPKSMQVNNGEWVKYINCIGLYYELDQPTKLRWTAPGMGSYSHTTFEMSLLKRPQSLKKYTAMIVDIINNVCITKRDPDDKILIFAATKDMCTHLTNAFKNQWPLMTINRYVGEDDYENLISAEMVVSTLLSAGTAVDIPGLRYVLMTTARRSSQSNIQALGRLRQMKKKPDVNPEFYYLINRDIPKHIEYHKHKMEIFKDKVLNHKTMETHYRV